MITKRITSELSDETLGDIVEFRAILASPIGLDMMDIQRDFDIEISEDEDVDSSDAAEIAFFHIIELVQNRVDRVGEENYPFSLSDDGSRFVLKSDISNSGYIYLFCLLLSHPKGDDVLTGSYLPNINDSERRLFQSCSTVAAAGIIIGNAVTFGFPRPDRSGFHSKLKEVYALIEDGEPRKTLMRGTPTDIKDFQIDVIAWKHRHDAKVLVSYFLAQVASGKNWEGKSLSNDRLDFFHELFFSTRPSMKPDRGIFIPFIFEYESNISLEDKLKIFEKMYGKFHYRFSIPQHYANGYEISQKGDLVYIEGVPDLIAVKSWVSSEIQRITETSS